MNRMPAILVAAAAALAAPAFAQTTTYSTPERVTTTWYDPATRTWVEHTTEYLPVERRSPVVTYVEREPAYYAPDITVTAPRGTEDELITRDVVDTIASDPHLQGRVGVETYRNNVTLTGRVTSPVQVERAERDAKAVEGVRDVTNLLRPRVGG